MFACITETFLSNKEQKARKPLVNLFIYDLVKPFIYFKSIFSKTTEMNSRMKLVDTNSIHKILMVHWISQMKFYIPHSWSSEAA